MDGSTPEAVCISCRYNHQEADKRLRTVETNLAVHVTELTEKFHAVQALTTGTHETVKSFGESLKKVETKVFNGFGESVVNLNKRVVDYQTTTDEKLAGLSKSMNKLTYFVVGSLITIFMGLLGIFGSIWVQNINLQKELISVTLKTIPATVQPDSSVEKPN